MKQRFLSYGIPLSLVVALVFGSASLFTSAGGQERPGRRGGGQGPGAGGASELEKAPIAKSDQEKKVLAVLAEIKGDRSKQYRNVSDRDGRFMRMLAESAGANRIVEIGMSTGYSGLWFALALQKTGGKLITHEISPERIKVASELFKKAGVDSLITIIEGDAHEKVKQHKEPIDILFLDADKAGYIDYLSKLLPLIRPGGLILAHNMRMPRADPKFVEAITTNPDLDTMFVLMDGAGVSVTMKKR